MTNEEISSFLAVVKTGSLSGAADLLYVTHPALTHRLKSLEEELGYSLFIRRPGIRCVTLTPKGEAFVAIAEQWTNLTHKAYELRDAETSERFSIAAIESISSLIMAPVCQKLIQQYSNLRLSIKLQYSANTYADMLNHSVDFGIINNMQYTKELHCRPAFREKMLFICRANSNVPEVINPEELNGKDSVFVPWSTDFEMWYQYWFHDKDDYGIFLQSTYILKDCLNTGQKWSIVPASVGNWLNTFPEFELHDIYNGPVPRMNYFLTHNNDTSPYIEKVSNLLREELSCRESIDILF